MAYQRRPSGPTNTIKLNLDPDTFDRLKARAGKDSMERTAYRLLQAALASDQTSSGGSIEAELGGYDLSALPSFRKDP